MTRAMSLTLLLMATSIAAAVAAPGAEQAAAPSDCGRSVAAAPVRTAAAGTAVAVVPVVLPARARADRAAPTGGCAADAGAPYRQWHHGNLKLNLGCAAAADT